MRPRDTSPEAQRLMDEHYRRMSVAEKAEALRQAWRTARRLQLAGLRSQFPDESEDQLQERLERRWLGDELYERRRAWKETHGRGG